jgi:hypothetical protein
MPVRRRFSQNEEQLDRSRMPRIFRRRRRTGEQQADPDPGAE